MMARSGSGCGIGGGVVMMVLDIKFQSLSVRLSVRLSGPGGQRLRCFGPPGARHSGNNVNSSGSRAEYHFTTTSNPYTACLTNPTEQLAAADPFKSRRRAAPHPSVSSTGSCSQADRHNPPRETTTSVQIPPSSPTPPATTDPARQSVRIPPRRRVRCRTRCPRGLASAASGPVPARAGRGCPASSRTGSSRSNCRVPWCAAVPWA